MEFKRLFLEKMKKGNIVPVANGIVSQLLSSDASIAEDKLASYLSNRVEFFKSTIGAMGEHIAKLKANVEDRFDETYVNTIKVYELKFDNLFIEAILEGTLFKGDNFKLDLPVIFGEYDYLNIGMFKDYLARLPKSVKINAYKRLTEFMAGRIALSSIVLSDGIEMIQAMLAIAYSLDTENPLTNTRGSIQDYRSAISSARGILSNFVTTKYEESKKFNSNKILIIASGKNSILVSPVVLKEYYSKGGDISSLLGAALKGVKRLTLEIGLNNIDVDKRVFEQDYQGRLLKKQAESNGILMDEYKKFFYDKVSNGELADILEFCKTLNDVDLADIQKVVEYAYGKVKFKESGLDKFLDYTNYYKKEGLEFRDATANALVNMLVDYITDNINITN